MKFIIIIFILFTQACSKNNPGTKVGRAKSQEVETYYTCSMHPSVHEDGPGKCPICHMNLTKIEIQKNNTQNEKKPELSYYYCQNDPSVQSEAPGECPLDGTPMLKKEKLEVMAQIRLTKMQVKHFKADLFSVQKMKMKKKIRLLGTLIKSEKKESNIPARVPGRVEKVLIDSTGAFIKKGDAVIQFYGPDLLTGGEEYLLARESYFKNKNNKEFQDLY